MKHDRWIVNFSTAPVPVCPHTGTPKASCLNLRSHRLDTRPRGKWLNEKGEEVGLELTFAPERLITEIWIKDRKGVGERKKRKKKKHVSESFFHLSCASLCAHMHTPLVNNAAGAVCHTYRSLHACNIQRCEASSHTHTFGFLH